MVGDNVRDVLKESHIKLFGWVITSVVVVAGAAYLLKSYYEMRNTLAQYRINQFLQKDWKNKYPELEIKQY